MTKNNHIPRIRLSHRAIVKSPGLLPMLYKVSELAEELSIPERTLRDWLAHGVPHERDRAGHLWIQGQAFAGWVATQRQKAPGARLKPGEGYCMFCKQIVRMDNPTLHTSAGKLACLQGTCPQCNHKVARGARHDPA